MNARPVPSSSFGRVAVVHDWLTGMRGGEAVLEGILEVVPQAELFTLFHFPGSVSKRIESHVIHTSRLQPLAVARCALGENGLRSCAYRTT